MKATKTVLITGASSGIGAACAKLFAQHGAKLILCARRLEKIQATAKILQEQFNAISYCVELDVRDKNAVTKQIENLPTEWQDIDVLINNAGLAAGLDFFYDANIDDWEQMIDTNVKGLLYVTRAIIPRMKARNQGHIINIGSIAGHEVYPKGNVYCASKFAVSALTKGFKQDLLGTKIRVSSIDPGMVETDFSLVRFKGDQKRAESVYKGLTPLTPEDIADAVYYCASRPPHVNVLDMILFPVDQSAATLVHRE